MFINHNSFNVTFGYDSRVSLSIRPKYLTILFIAFMVFIRKVTGTFPLDTTNISSEEIATTNIYTVLVYKYWTQMCFIGARTKITALPY